MLLMYLVPPSIPAFVFIYLFIFAQKLEYETKNSNTQM